MRYEFTQDCMVDESASKRAPVSKGTIFNAVEADEIIIDKTGVQPREVKTGRKNVVSSDLNVLPGCLTSCIRTGLAKRIDDAKPTNSKK